MCCHDSYWSRRILLVREMKMSIQIPRLTAAVSMLHECRSLLRMASCWRVDMVSMRPRGTSWTVMDTTMLGRHFGVLRRGVWCVNHNTGCWWCNVLVNHTRDVNVPTATTGLCTVMFALLWDFVRRMCHTHTAITTTRLLRTISRWRRFFYLQGEREILLLQFTSMYSCITPP